VCWHCVLVLTPECNKVIFVRCFFFSWLQACLRPSCPRGRLEGNRRESGFPQAHEIAPMIKSGKR